MKEKEYVINPEDYCFDKDKHTAVYVGKKPLKIYLAGEMNKNADHKIAEWRNDLIKYVTNNFNIIETKPIFFDRDESYIISRYINEEQDKETNCIFLCPEFAGCDHNGIDPDSTVKNDLAMIDKSDVVIAYLNRDGLYSTICEVMYARERNKELHIIIDEKIRLTVWNVEGDTSPYPSFYKKIGTKHGCCCMWHPGDKYANEYWFLLTLLSSYSEIYIGDLFESCQSIFGEHFSVKEETKQDNNNLNEDLNLLKKEHPDFVTTRIIERYHRNYKLTKELKQKHKECMICNFTFKKKNGEPYNEMHHIILLSENGKDEAINTLVLCANCHRQLHYATVDISNILSSNKIIINGVEKKIHSALNGV